MLTTERAAGNFAYNSSDGSSPFVNERFSSSRGTGEAWSLVWRYKKFLAFVITVGALLSLLLSFALPAEYAATSAIVFDRNDTRPYEAVVEAQKQERDKSSMDTELDIIRSRVFMGTVVDALNLVADPFYNSYLSVAEPNALSLVVRRISGWFLGGEERDGRRAPTNRIISETAQRDRAITTLLGTFTVDRKGDSLALTITVRQPSPIQAAAVADAIARHYVEWTSNLKSVATSETIKYLRQQSDELAVSITKREREIAAFTATSDLTFDPKDDLLRARTEQLNEQFTLARVDEAGEWAKVNEAKARLASGGEEDIGKVVTSDLLTSLRTEGARLQRLRGQLTSKFGNNHPLVIDADAEIASNRKMILDEASRILQELENNARVASIRVKNFEQAVSVLQDRVQSRNLAEIRRRELERDLLSEQKRYDAVELRLSALDPDREQFKATAMVSSFAEVPVQPSFPQPLFIFGAGLVGSSLLALMGMIILDNLDSRIHSSRTVSAILGRPNIVSVPGCALKHDVAKETGSRLLADENSGLAIAARTLCLAWKTIDSSPGSKVVMFTSTSRRDGKTMLSVAMAASAQREGLSTILVDLSAGAVNAYSVTSSRGLANSPIAGSDLKHMVTRSPSYPFLDVLTGRPSLQQYRELFNALRQHYDLVIVDTPATDTAQDAIWLSAHVDSIFVIGVLHKTRQAALVDLVERLNLNHAFIIGGIINSAADHGSSVKRIDWTIARNMLASLRVFSLKRST
ncbi:Wzz/FepE/Etk N-terminal domain-containing protein (plasmid) [Rhizobium sullae]|nr:Wzz/FepE/Etk N-terminal domain-containing protein [Rhizobium sullae]UWU18390.1 Wzz/FepE/Etk N-terminal domain-containing protein [Rhizobium sullae]